MLLVALALFPLLALLFLTTFLINLEFGNHSDHHGHYPDDTKYAHYQEIKILHGLVGRCENRVKESS